MEIILATYNQGKAREIEAILDPVKVKCLKDLGVEIDFDAVEDGETYAENALRKVRAAAEKVDGIIAADDSGLEVAALDGRPGVHSARYGGPDVPDSKRYRKLLEEMNDVPEGGRSARFFCVVAVRWPEGTEKFFDGECRGEISREPRGGGGFGYDPVFLLPDRGMTMAEIPPEEKNRISHRYHAFRSLRAALLGE